MATSNSNFDKNPFFKDHLLNRVNLEVITPCVSKKKNISTKLRNSANTAVTLKCKNLTSLNSASSECTVSKYYQMDKFKFSKDIVKDLNITFNNNNNKENKFKFDENFSINSQMTVKNNNSSSFTFDKPNLNLAESRLKLNIYSKSKEYKNSLFDISPIIKFPNNNHFSKQSVFSCTNSELNSFEIERDGPLGETTLENMERELPVPVEKKDDEIFKLKKMYEMRKKSLPAYKSARFYDSNEVSVHQEQLNNGK